MKNNRNLGGKHLELYTCETLSVDDLCEKVANTLQDQIKSKGIIEHFIANLDLLFEDWDITVNLINHFDALKEEYLKDVLEEGEQNPFHPKKINVR